MLREMNIVDTPGGMRTYRSAVVQVTGLSACLQALHGTSVILERQQRLIKEHMPLFS